MISKARFFCCLLFLTVNLISLPVTAANESHASYYITTATLPPELLAPPSPEDSPDIHRQLNVIVSTQKRVTKTTLAALRDEQQMRLELITKVMGDHFTRANKPKTFALLDHALNDASLIVENDKKFWRTRRPYLVDHRVKLLIDPLDTSPAYPSGHTAESRVIAEVLGLLYPDRREALRKQAEDIAWHRVMAGVHYPEDLWGGRSLAMLIVGAFMESDNFQDDLEAAKRENATP